MRHLGRRRCRSAMMVPLPYWRLSGFYFFYFALLGATAPFLALYFDHLGFDAERIGELIAIPMLMRCVAPNLWGWLGDRSGRRLEIVRLGALCTLASFGLIFLDKSFAWLALVMALHAFFWHAVLPQFEVLQPGAPLGQHRLHRRRGRAGPGLRALQPRLLPALGHAGDDRHRRRQRLGA